MNVLCTPGRTLPDVALVLPNAITFPSQRFSFFLALPRSFRWGPKFLSGMFGVGNIA